MNDGDKTKNFNELFKKIKQSKNVQRIKKEQAKDKKKEK
jgi:hypothetical protein